MVTVHPPSSTVPPSSGRGLGSRRAPTAVTCSATRSDVPAGPMEPSGSWRQPGSWPPTNESGCWSGSPDATTCSVGSATPPGARVQPPGRGARARGGAARRRRHQQPRGGRPPVRVGANGRHHLQRIDRKLGVTGHAGLADALGGPLAPACAVAAIAPATPGDQVGDTGRRRPARRTTPRRRRTSASRSRRRPRPVARIRASDRRRSPRTLPYHRTTPSRSRPAIGAAHTPWQGTVLDPGVHSASSRSRS